MNILRGRGNGRNIKIICNWNGQDYLRPTVLLFRWNDENWYNFRAMFSQGGAKRYTYRCLFLKGCIPDSQGLYPEPQGSIASGIQRSKYQSCRIERGWPEGTFAIRINSYELVQDFTGKWIYLYEYRNW